MEKLFIYDYFLCMRFADGIKILENEIDLNSQDLPEQLKSYFDLRKLYYECDYLVSTGKAENNVEKLNSMINTLKTKWEAEGINKKDIDEFWVHYHQYLAILCIKKYQTADEINSIIHKVFDKEEDITKVMDIIDKHKARNLSGKEMVSLLASSVKAISNSICNFEIHSMPENLIGEYITSLRQKQDSPAKSVQKASSSSSSLSSSSSSESEDEDSIYTPEQQQSAQPQSNQQSGWTTQPDLEFTSSESSESESESKPSPKSSKPVEKQSLEQLVNIFSRTSRSRWTSEEVSNLLEGVRHYGLGQWRLIQRKYLPERTNVMVKDKVRTMMNSKNPTDRKRLEASLNYYLKKHRK